MPPGAVLPHVFVSYRRDDASGDAGRLADHLHRRFGTGRVFFDIETIEPGVDFVQVLRDALGQTAAVLVVIGPRWTSLRHADGTRRIDDPNDFVRIEIEAALSRPIPVVPVLVQGATLPRADELPPSLAPLVTRQVAVLDHAEFRDDVERLCDRLATVLGDDRAVRRPFLRRWAAVVALAAIVVLGAAGWYYATRTTSGEPVPTSGVPDPVPVPQAETDTAATEPLPPPVPPAVPGNAATPAPGPPPRETVNAATPAAPAIEDTQRVDALLAEAAAQHRRSQFVEALATLARAREAAPRSEVVRRTQEDVAMEWIRNVRFASGTSTFADAIAPGLAVIDAALPSATGTHRADLLAHSGWASFLLWRDGNQQVDPAEWYREALALDPENPYANAMLAHWGLFRGRDVSSTVTLFETALRTGRAVDAVRTLQWAAYRNANRPDTDLQLVRVADAMRRDGQKLTVEQASMLWIPYSSRTRASNDDLQVLLEVLPPDDHISTLAWAFEAYAAQDESRRQTIRYYVALLHASAGRVDRAVDDLRTLNKERPPDSGSLGAAVQAALGRLQPGRR